MKKMELKQIARDLLRHYQVRSTRSEQLLRALRRGNEIYLAKGDVLCQQGEESDRMFVLTSGSVRVLRRDYLSRNREVATISAPCIIGEMGLVDGSVRSATCIASEDMHALTIDQQTFDQLMQEKSPTAAAFRHQLIAVMMADLSRSNAMLCTSSAA